MKQHDLVKNIFYSLTATAILTGASLAADVNTVEAAVLEQGATVEALDANGESALALTSVVIQDGDTAEDVFNRAAEKNNTTFGGDQHPEYGLTVKEVGGLKPSGETEYWSLVDNGQYAQKGVSSLEVENGDNLRFQLVDWTVEAQEVPVSLSALDAKGHYVIEESKLQLQPHSTAHDALNSAAKQQGVPVSLSVDDTYHAFVNQIGDQPLEEDEFWSFTVNGEMAETGISSYRLQADDKIQFQVQSMKANAGGSTDSTDQTTDQKEEKKESNSKDLADSGLSFSKSLEYLSQQNPDLSYGNEWEVIAKANLGQDIPADYLKSVTQTVKENQGQLGRLENQKVIIALTLMGEDPRNVAGYDLVKEMIENPTITTLNGQIYTLLAADSGAYQLPAGKRQELVEIIVNSELEQGGFAFYGNQPSIDISAMALAALAPYQEQAEVKAVINRTVEFLSQQQTNNGGFINEAGGGDTSEAVSQVIIGLSTVGVDPSSESFTKDGHDLLDHLADFQNADGSFSHLEGVAPTNSMSSQQALLAQIAYQKFLNGEGSIYALSTPQKDENLSSEKDQTETPAEEKPTETPAEEKPTEEKPAEEKPTEDKNNDANPATDKKEQKPAGPSSDQKGEMAEQKQEEKDSNPAKEPQQVDEKLQQVPAGEGKVSTLASQEQEKDDKSSVSTEKVGEESASLPATGVSGGLAFSLAFITSGLGLAYHSKKDKK